MKRTPAANGRFGEIAALAPQKRQCEFGSYYPAGTLVKPLPRKAAWTLWASLRTAQRTTEELKAESGSKTKILNFMYQGVTEKGTIVQWKPETIQKTGRVRKAIRLGEALIFSTL